MTYKQIEASRELKRWIGPVFVPATIGLVALAWHPSFQEAMNDKDDNVKEFVTDEIEKY